MYRLSENYSEKISHEIDNFNQISFNREIGYEFALNIFSANLGHLLPNIEQSNHETIFQKSLLHKYLMKMDEQVINLPDFIKVKGDFESIKKEFNSVIFCGFHLGSYRSIFPFLVKNEVNLNLLVGEDVFRQDASMFKQRFLEGKEFYKVNSSFDVINGEDKASVIKGIRGLKEGKSIVTFLDGNTGVGGNHRQDEKMTKVDFLNQDIFVRKGIGYLSYVTHTPIIPVMIYRDEDFNNTIEFLEPIIPNIFLSRYEFIDSFNQNIYDAFSAYLLKYPEQWESWSYMHKFLDLTKINQISYQPLVKKTFLDWNRFSISTYENGSIIFDKYSFLIHFITNEIFDLLNRLKNDDIQIETFIKKIGNDSFKLLQEKGLLGV